MTNTLSYHSSTASHEWSIILVSASSWFPRSMTLSLLVDIASVASDNPPPVTSSYGCWRTMPFVIITSDKNVTRSALFLSSDMKLLQASGSGTFWSSTSLRMCFFGHALWSCHILVWTFPNVAIEYHINPSCMLPKMTCDLLHENVCVVSKRLTSITLPKWLDECVPINEHACLRVRIWNLRWYVHTVRQDGISSAFIVVLLSPLGCATDGMSTPSVKTGSALPLLLYSYHH